MNRLIVPTICIHSKHRAGFIRPVMYDAPSTSFAPGRLPSSASSSRAFRAPGPDQAPTRATTRRRRMLRCRRRLQHAPCPSWKSEFAARSDGSNALIPAQPGSPYRRPARSTAACLPGPSSPIPDSDGSLGRRAVRWRGAEAIACTDHASPIHHQSSLHRLVLAFPPWPRQSAMAHGRSRACQGSIGNGGDS